MSRIVQKVHLVVLNIQFPDFKRFVFLLPPFFPITYRWITALISSGTDSNAAVAAVDPAYCATLSWLITNLYESKHLAGINKACFFAY
jgi:hypothetical protein